MAKVKQGADYGMSLLWTIFLSCAITYFLINLFGKYTLVTGETTLAAIKKRIHPAVAFFFIITLTAHVCGSTIGIMGIVSDVCYEWSKNFTTEGIQPIYFALLFISIIYALFLQGSTQLFERTLAVIVGIMAICFLINFFLLMPPLMDLMNGMIPNIPETGEDSSAFLVIASMVGTTVFSGLFILRSTLVKEAGWTMADLKTQQKDALFSGFLMFFVSAAIMAAAAGSLHIKGVTLTKVSELISLNYRIFVFFMSLLGLIVPIFNAKPIAIMILSQAFGALVLPATVACIIYLGNEASQMKAHKFTLGTNLVLGAILLFAMMMSYMSFTGIFATLESLSN